MNTLIIDRKHLSHELSTAFDVLDVWDMPVPKENAGLQIIFTTLSNSSRKMEIRRNRDSFQVFYSDLSAALRAISSLVSRPITEKSIVTESSNFSTIGFLLDCSRNAVMKSEYLQIWLKKLALLGFNMGMLYTEDTYELSGEEYFGL